MSNAKQFNNLSKKLKEEIAKALPKKGQTITFVSVRPGQRGTTVLPYDTIWDPWGGEDGKGDMVDIACLKSAHAQMGSINGALSEEPKHIKNLDRIQFSKKQGGRIVITGGDRRGEARFQFMFLTNQNKNNIPTKDTPKKDWYVEGSRSVTFYMQEPEKSATQKLEFNRLVRQAGDAIDEMADSKLKDFALGLDLKGVTKFTSSDEIRVLLLNMASSNPNKILQLDKDESLKVKILIKEAEKFGIIVFNSALSQYEWANTGDSICVVPPANKGIEVICSYLLDKGREVKKTIERLVDAQKEDKGKKGK